MAFDARFASFNLSSSLVSFVLAFFFVIGLASA
jgi:hypothetical protein